MKYNNRYSKLQFLERFTANIVSNLKKAAPRFELGIKDLQSSALPLGHAAVKDANQSDNNPNRTRVNSLLIISNGHGEDVIALELIKKFLRTSEFNKIEVMPLVGNGYIFNSVKDKSFRIIGNLKVLPSGGFSNQSFTGLILDLISGLLIISFQNWKIVRSKSKEEFKIIAVGDLLPLLFAWSSNCDFGFIGTPKSDHTWSNGPGWKLSDFYHKLKGSEWDPWEMSIMKSSRCKAIIMRDSLTAENLKKKRINANYFGNPMMDFLKENNLKLKSISSFKRIILLIGSRFPEALKNLDSFLSCLDIYEISSICLVLVPLSNNANIKLVEKFFKSYGFIEQKQIFSLGEESVWAKNNIFLLLGKSTFNEWCSLAQVGLANAGTATEQIAGLGVPSLSYPGSGPQFTRSFALRQSRLLGGSVLVFKDKKYLVKRLDMLLHDKKERDQQAKIGIERMGDKGASENIVLYLRNKLLSQ